jgi:transposase
MIRKLSHPSGPGVNELAAKTEVHQTTLSRWRREATILHAKMSPKRDDETETKPQVARRPQDFLPEDKLRIVQQAMQLRDADLGAFLKREGLHEADLAEWCEQVNEAALATLSGRRQRTSEQKRVRKLEREQRRKEKALAEAAALLVLAKKPERSGRRVRSLHTRAELFAPQIQRRYGHPASSEARRRRCFAWSSDASTCRMTAQCAIEYPARAKQADARMRRQSRRDSTRMPRSPKRRIPFVSSNVCRNC